MQSTSDNTSCGQETTFPKVPWIRFAAVLPVYALAIVLLTWPWLRTISSRVINHWDPFFHAWKLHYAATQILSGNLLPPEGNTNMYYPHTGAFYYEALHWPQAVFAALLEALGTDPIVSYHVTLVFFWALSGALFWAFLRAVGLRGIAAFIGGLVFTVMPYRISYVMEFNMQLSLGLPLFLFFAVRFFQRPSIWYALGAALAWWIQATSELYQAIFFLFAVPCIAAALLARDPALLRSWRKFWMPFSLAAIAGGLISFVFLSSYLTLLGSDTLVRSNKEILQHCLEPFSLFQPFDHFHLIPLANVRYDEMSVYPTVSLLVAGFAAAFVTWRKRPGICRGIRDICLCLFVVLSTVIFLNVHLNHNAVKIYSWLPVAVVIFSLPLLFDKRDTSVRDKIFAAMGVSGLFGFFMMFGPELQNIATGFRTDNVLCSFLLDHIKGLHGFRVISRFCILPVMWICAAAACGVERLLLLNRKIISYAVLAVLSVLFLAECIHYPIETRPVRDVSQSTALRMLDDRTEPYVLAIVPMGFRDLDSEHMFCISGTKRLSIYAWGGCFPRYTSAVKDMFSFEKRNPDRAVYLLRQLWPEALILEDKRQFPFVPYFNYQTWLGKRVETLAEDSCFRLMKLSPDETENRETIRLVRHDMLAKFQTATFELRSNSPAYVRLDINGVNIGNWNTGPEPVRHQILIPQSLNIRLMPNRFRFHTDDNACFHVSDFKLEAESNNAETVNNNRFARSWLSSYEEIPEDARLPVVKFPNRLKVAGAELVEANESGVIRVRYFICPPESPVDTAKIFLGTGITDKDRKILFEANTPLIDIFDMSQCESGVKGKYFAVEQTIYKPDFNFAETTCGLVLTVRDGNRHSIYGTDPKGKEIHHMFY